MTTNRIIHLYNQITALLAKRYIHITRNKFLSTSQILIPIALVLINLLYIKYAVLEPEQSPALKMQLNDYGHNYAPYLINGNTEKNGYFFKISKIYENMLNSYLMTKSFQLNETKFVGLCQSSRKSIENYLSCLGRESFRMLNKEHFVAIEFNSDKNRIIGHFNNQPYHVPPLVLNLITNSLLKYYTNSSDSSITVINKPLPKKNSQILKDSTSANLNSFRLATALNFGLSFLIASFSIFLIKEKTSGSKHLQYLNGCNPFIFWFSAFVSDLLNFLIPVVFLIGLLIVSFKKKHFPN